VAHPDDDAPEPMPQDEERDAVAGGEPDVLLDVSDLKVEEISVEVEDLRAQVSLQADVLQLLRLHVGVEAELGRVKLTIKGVEAKALLKVRLDNVARILERVLETLDNNPDIVEGLLEHVGEAVQEVGAGAGEAVGAVGTGAGEAVGEVGAGASSAVADVGGAVGDVSRGAGRAVEDVAEGLAGEDAEAEERPSRPREEEPQKRRTRRTATEGRQAKKPRPSRGRRSEGGR
jgi:hypothetical protein